MTATTRYQGFTLVEVLIVVTIIGIVLAAVMLALPSRQDRAIEQIAASLTSQLQLASQEAQLKFAQYGFSITPGEQQSYQFYQLDENNSRWEPIKNRVAFRASILPKKYALRIITDDAFIALRVANPPLIEFHANGDITPFILSISDNKQQLLYQIEGDLAGNIRLRSSGLGVSN